MLFFSVTYTPPGKASCERYRFWVDKYALMDSTQFANDEMFWRIKEAAELKWLT